MSRAIREERFTKECTRRNVFWVCDGCKKEALVEETIEGDTSGYGGKTLEPKGWWVLYPKGTAGSVAFSEFCEECGPALNKLHGGDKR